MTSLLLALILNNATALLYGWLITGVVGDLVLWWPRQGERLSRLPLLILGWPLIILAVFSLYQVLYPIANRNSDTQRAEVISLALLLWAILAGVLAILKLRTVSEFSGLGSALGKAALCWGVILILTLAFSLDPWGMAFYKFVNSDPNALLGYLGSDMISYLGLGLIQVLAGIFGSILWFLWVRPRPPQQHT